VTRNPLHLCLRKMINGRVTLSVEEMTNINVIDGDMA